MLSTINKFDAPSVRVKFTVNTESHYVEDPQVIEPSHDSLGDIQKDLVEHAKTFVQDQSAADLSSFFGNIQVINPPRVTQENGGNTGTVQAAETDDPLQVSIPVGNIGSNKAEKFGEFLLFQLDLSGYRHTTALIGFLGYTFLGLFSVVLVSGLALTVERNDDLVFANEELHQAFEEVGAVLWEAPVPYTQLDSEDRIRNCNRALCDFLGYGYSVLVSTKFRDLIHDDDKAKYDEVQQKRRENQQVEPYDMRFVKENGDEVVAWIVSAPVPSVSGGMLGALPETFGIFLKTRPSDHKVIPMPPRSPIKNVR